MLHTINKSPFESPSMQECARFAAPGDPVLFIENGVYAVQSGNRFASEIEALLKTNPVYVLQPDAEARGISSLTGGVEPVGYDGFVDLVEAHRVNSWL
ncbi:sulfurtransferase complex subunit TusB [Chlorobium sp. N1]|uniref:sulfurtransferase complex subunit TusB n=1 Tax=Chlorobium sp. N1 TaxID=2491138 RepID=UPI00103CAD4F|nr:sulfurtransferase complex subunit TusB [Chlorobium sp. N1]TCD48235.1 sulfurtransferase complex subunit TusB [Chlorobium sp. N1]